MDDLGLAFGGAISAMAATITAFGTGVLFSAMIRQLAAGNIGASIGLCVLTIICFLVTALLVYLAKSCLDDFFFGGKI